jgi:hypothetical protein
LSEEEKRNVGRIVALVKIKERPVSGKDLFLAGNIVKLVQKGLGIPKIDRNGKMIDKFNVTTHTRCYKKYKVKPNQKDVNPSNTNTNFCIDDEPTGNYRYTKAWVDFLIKKMEDEFSVKI